MHTTTYRRAYYTMTKLGYGSYKIVKETKKERRTVITTNALIWDWMNDDSDKKLHKEALRQLSGAFYRHMPTNNKRKEANG